MTKTKSMTDKNGNPSLKKMWQRRGFTQYTFARAMGTTMYRVGNWQRYGVPVDKVDEAAKLLKVPVDKLPVYINDRPGVYEYGNARPNYRRRTLKTQPPTKTVQPQIDATAPVVERLKALDEAFKINIAALDEAKLKLETEYMEKRQSMVGELKAEIDRMEKMVAQLAAVTEAVKTVPVLKAVG